MKYGLPLLSLAYSRGGEYQERIMRSMMGRREMHDGIKDKEEHEKGLSVYLRHGRARAISLAGNTSPAADRFAVVGVKTHFVERGIRPATVRVTVPAAMPVE